MLLDSLFGPGCEQRGLMLADLANLLEQITYESEGFSHQTTLPGLLICCCQPCFLQEITNTTLLFPPPQPTCVGIKPMRVNDLGFRLGRRFRLGLQCKRNALTVGICPGEFHQAASSSPYLSGLSGSVDRVAARF